MDCLRYNMKLKTIATINDSTKQLNRDEKKEIYKAAATVASKKFGKRMKQENAREQAVNAMIKLTGTRLHKKALLNKQNGPFFYYARRAFDDAYESDKKQPKNTTATVQNAFSTNDDFDRLLEGVNQLNDVEDKDEIVELLKKTKEYRKDKFKTLQNIHRRNLFFDFFKTEPEFISVDFENYFPGKGDKISRFNRFAKYFTEILKNEKLIKNKTLLNLLGKLPDEAKPFAHLMYLTGYKPLNVTAKSEPFEVAFEKIMVLNQRSEDIASYTGSPMLNLKTNNENKIVQIIIKLNIGSAIEIPLKKGTSLIKAFDYVFKLYELFDLSYDKVVERCLSFFAEYVYELRVHNIPKNIELMGAINFCINPPAVEVANPAKKRKQ